MRLEATEFIEVFRRIQRRAEAEALEIEVLPADVDRLRAMLAAPPPDAGT